jgi:hypothetical protein
MYGAGVWERVEVRGVRRGMRGLLRALESYYRAVVFMYCTVCAAWCVFGGASPAPQGARRSACSLW